MAKIPVTRTYSFFRGEEIQGAHDRHKKTEEEKGLRGKKKNPRTGLCNL